MKNMWNKSVVYKVVVGILVLVIGVGALGLSAFAEDVAPTPTSEIEPTEAPTTPSPTASPEATATPDSNENIDKNVNNDEKTDENTDEKVENEEVNQEENEEEKNEDETHTGENEIAIVDAGTSTITFDTNGGTLDNKTTVEATTGSNYGFLAGEGKHFASSADNENLGYKSYDFGSTLTISTKVSFDTFDCDTGGEQIWFSNLESGGFGFGYNKSTDSFYFEVHTNGSYHLETAKRNTIKTNETHWFTGVYDANTDKMEFYIDGVLQKGGSVHNSAKKNITIANAQVSMGNNPKPDASFGKQQFYGMIYKAGLWTSALTQAQVTDMIENDYINKEALINTDYTPRNSNYPFEGWYEDLNDPNSKITANTKIIKSTTLYAKWKGLSKIIIDPNGGTYKGNSSKTSEEVASGTVYELNEIPVRSGYTFQGWKLRGGTEIGYVIRT